jgi:hypothetical protein
VLSNHRVENRLVETVCRNVPLRRDADNRVPVTNQLALLDVRLVRVTAKPRKHVSGLSAFKSRSN